jgi:hypothetical protein
MINGQNYKYFFQQFEKINTYEVHENYGVRIFDVCTKFLMFEQNK